LPFSGPLSALLSSSLLVYLTALLVAAAALPSAAAISHFRNVTSQHPLLRLADGRYNGNTSKNHLLCPEWGGEKGKQALQVR